MNSGETRKNDFILSGRGFFCDELIREHENRLSFFWAGRGRRTPPGFFSLASLVSFCIASESESE
jgi:hypothetical protein